MKKIAVLLLFLLPSLGFGLTPEQRSAQTAARINAGYQTKSSHTAKIVRSQAAAVEINKKVWVLTDPTNVVMSTPKTTTTTTSWSTRAPVGHTHTCKNGHTWDHQLSTSHNCPYCGAFQNVQDRTPRPVTIKVAAASSFQATPDTAMTAPTITVTPQRTVIQELTLPSNCANGQCQNPSVRFFR